MHNKLFIILMHLVVHGWRGHIFVKDVTVKKLTFIVYFIFFSLNTKCLFIKLKILKNHTVFVAIGTVITQIFPFNKPFGVSAYHMKLI